MTKKEGIYVYRNLGNLYFDQIKDPFEMQGNLCLFWKDIRIIENI